MAEFDAPEDDMFDESLMDRARVLAAEVGDPFLVLRAAVELFAATPSESLADTGLSAGDRHRGPRRTVTHDGCCLEAGRVSTNAMEAIAAARVPGHDETLAACEEEFYGLARRGDHKGVRRAAEAFKHLARAEGTMPGGWCEVHHHTHWKDGGLTCIENGCLLCPYHHRFLHRRPDWTSTFIDQVLRIYRPNGREVLPDPWNTLAA